MLFDLSNIHRQEIINNISACQENIVNKSLTINNIFYMLKKQITKYYPILVKKYISPDKNFLIGGKFLIEKDILRKKSIVLDIFFPNVDIIKISKNRFASIVKTISDTILHEIIHMRQYRSQNYQITYFPSYFSKIEIEAYAFNIACELFDLSSNLGIVKKQINHLLKQSNTWDMYAKLCKYNDTHIILIRLKKYVMKALPLAQQGFPFKSKKWLK